MNPHSIAAGKLTDDMRRALTAAANGNFRPDERTPDPTNPGRTRLKTHHSTTRALKDRGYIEPKPNTTIRWQATPLGHAVLTAPLPHVTRLLGAQAGYTDKPFLAIRTNADTEDGRTPEPEAINVEQLNPSWANGSSDRHATAQNPHHAARRIRAMRRAA